MPRPVRNPPPPPPPMPSAPPSRRWSSAHGHQRRGYHQMEDEKGGLHGNLLQLEGMPGTGAGGLQARIRRAGRLGPRKTGRPSGIGTAGAFPETVRADVARRHIGAAGIAARVLLFRCHAAGSPGFLTGGGVPRASARSAPTAGATLSSTGGAAAVSAGGIVGAIRAGTGLCGGWRRGGRGGGRWRLGQEGDRQRNGRRCGGRRRDRCRSCRGYDRQTVEPASTAGAPADVLGLHCDGRFDRRRRAWPARWCAAPWRPAVVTTGGAGSSAALVLSCTALGAGVAPVPGAAGAPAPVAGVAVCSAGLPLLRPPQRNSS